jgi:hypothetical protein
MGSAPDVVPGDTAALHALDDPGKGVLEAVHVDYLQCDVKDFLTYDKVALTGGATTS